MARTVFYSWQSDLSTKVNRNFIRTCLDAAIMKINKEVEVAEPEREPLNAEDGVKGISGTPDVANTIFERIDQCEVFVADISIIGKIHKGRRVPNPNVMIEYGRAVKSIGDERILTVFNEAFGNWQRDRPFDLQHKLRPITYELRESDPQEDRAIAKDVLTGQLARGLKEILGLKPDHVQEPRKEALSERAARLQAKRDLEVRKNQFCECVDGVNAAKLLFKKLVGLIEIRAKELAEANDGLGLRTLFHSEIMVIQGMGPVMVVEWRGRFANSLKGSFLFASVYDGAPQLPGFNPVFDNPVLIKRMKFQFGLIGTDEQGYVPDGVSEPMYNVVGLAEYLLDYYLTAAENFVRLSSGVPTARRWGT